MSQLFNRHRRLRTSKAMREMVKETRLHPSDFIYPIFVVEGLEGKKAVPSMPDVYHVSLDLLKDEVAELVKLGIQSVIVFGIPEKKMIAEHKRTMITELSKKPSQKLKNTSLKWLLSLTRACANTQTTAIADLSKTGSFSMMNRWSFWRRQLSAKRKQVRISLRHQT